jgi:hypothetical protein
MLELIWFARGTVAMGATWLVAALLAPSALLEGALLDRRTIAMAGGLAVVVGAILVAVAGA